MVWSEQLYEGEVACEVESRLEGFQAVVNALSVEATIKGKIQVLIVVGGMVQLSEGTRGSQDVNELVIQRDFSVELRQVVEKASLYDLTTNGGCHWLSGS